MLVAKQALGYQQNLLFRQRCNRDSSTYFFVGSTNFGNSPKHVSKLLTLNALITHKSYLAAQIITGEATPSYLS